jgi:vitamin B12 transporter
VFKNVSITLIFSLLGAASTYAEVTDTDSLHTQSLKGVTVNGQALNILRSTLPLQEFSETEISRLNASNVSDIAKHFAGVTVKDYGGIGGMKTVSLRGLGALHTGVSYDGVIMSDIQSGQIDLGRFSIENISEVSLSNGQPNDIFQSARMFASSGVLSFLTKMPAYNEKHTLSAHLKVKTGSFGLVNPVIFLCKNFNSKWGISLTGDGLIASGRYTYISNINNQGSNLIKKTRVNSDVISLRTELDAICHLKTFEYISFKANQYYSERGLPGPDILYSNFSTDRLMDKNYLTQVLYENKQSCTFQYKFIGKYNNAFMRFTETDPKYSQLTDQKLTENYRQTEYYLSSILQYHPTESLSISGSSDWWRNDLFSHSNMSFKKDATPVRNTGLLNFATKYLTERFTAGANILYTLTRETTQTGEASHDRDKLSPTLNASYQLLENKELRLRVFYKNIFRLPTFSDLYFHDFGYVDLRPEITNQYNVGVVYVESEISFIRDLELNADGYYNLVTDKISIKYGMPYSSIRNIGRVDIKGLDAGIKFSIPIRKNTLINFNASYTYQLAQDMTPGSSNLGDQIPYTPAHSGSATVSCRYRKLEGGYNLLFSGKRWNGQNISSNLLPAYAEHSLFAGMTFQKFRITGEIINLFDSQYQIIKDYPMPGRNCRITISIDL